MAFKKGNKLGNGRPKGSQNKDLEPIRTAFRNFLENNVDQVQKDYDAMKNPKDRLYFIHNLAEYCIPKLQRSEITGKDGKDFALTAFNYIAPQIENGSNGTSNIKTAHRISETSGQDN